MPSLAHNCHMATRMSNEKVAVGQYFVQSNFRDQPWQASLEISSSHFAKASRLSTQSSAGNSRSAVPSGSGSDALLQLGFLGCVGCTAESYTSLRFRLSLLAIRSASSRRSLRLPASTRDIWEGEMPAIPASSCCVKPQLSLATRMRWWSIEPHGSISRATQDLFEGVA
jgi:hypothetical protein